LQNTKRRKRRYPTEIKNIIYVAVSIYTLILLAITLINYICIHKIDQKVYFWIQFENIDREILEVRRYEKTYLLYHNKEDLIYALNYVEKLETELQIDERLISKLNIRKEFSNLYNLIIEYKTTLEKMLESNGKIDPKLAKEIRDKGHKITIFFGKIRENITKKINKDIKIYSIIPLIIFMGVLLIVPATAYIFARWIIDPIEHLAYYAHEISEGHLNHIPRYRKLFFRYKEYDQLIDAINEMLDALNAKQKELIQATKMAAIGTTISGIAHEINNPLNNIFLTIEVIMESFDELSKEELLEMLYDIYHEGERAREIVAHLLEFARDKKDIPFEKLSLNKLAKDSYKIVANQARTKGIETKVELSKDDITIKGNFNQLQQVLINILVNAIQAMEKGGKLGIRTYQEGDWAVVEISDTGPGIPQEIQNKIFEPFFTTKEGGTGLGLSVSYSIIKKHQGDIEVESKPGKGSIFRIKLPLHKPRRNA